MEKMKKTATAILALMLIAAQAVTASAETVTGKNGSKSIDVKAKYTSGITTPDVYSVDVTWGKMEFTYSAAGTREWDSATHTYIDKTSASWNADGNDVTVVNHSNKDVNVNFAYASDSGYNGINGDFDTSSKTLNAGEEGNPDSADKVTAKPNLSGTLSNTVAKFTKVGSITISLS